MASCWLCEKQGIETIDDCDLCVKECPLFGKEAISSPVVLLMENEDLKQALKRIVEAEQEAYAEESSIPICGFCGGGYEIHKAGCPIDSAAQIIGDEK